VKNLNIKAIFLLLILVTPMVIVTASQLNITDDVCTLCEHNEEGKLTHAKEFILYNAAVKFFIPSQKLNFFVAVRKSSSTAIDVLTPPPELL